MEKIAVVGGGLSGSMMAILLARKGFQVELYERRPDMRHNRISAGRSINLALSTRGLKALERAGLAEEVLKEGIPMYGRTMHPVQGELRYQPYGKDGQAIYSVSRGLLNIKLLELADAFDNIQIFFEHKCVDVDMEKNSLQLEKPGGIHTTTVDRIIGSDGAYAATRSKLQTSDRFNYSQSYLEHGYKELSIPPTADGGFRLDKNSLHIWPRGGYMMIALPNMDGSFTCTLFFPFEGSPSFEQLKTEADVTNFFNEVFPDAVPLMPTLVEDFFQNPTSSLVTVRCYPWVRGGKLALIGDAAHAIVPFYGQGMNCSFEDCIVLDDCLHQYGTDWKQALDAYQRSRKPNADAIATLAVQNFYEMRDLVGTPQFLHRKQVEHELTERYSDLFQSQYELVTFSTEPYAEALRRGAINDQILDYIIKEKLETELANPARIRPIIEQFQKATYETAQ